MSNERVDSKQEMLNAGINTVSVDVSINDKKLNVVYVDVAEESMITNTNMQLSLSETELSTIKAAITMADNAIDKSVINNALRRANKGE